VNRGFVPFLTPCPYPFASPRVPFPGEEIVPGLRIKAALSWLTMQSGFAPFGDVSAGMHRQPPWGRCSGGLPAHRSAVGVGSFGNGVDGDRILGATGAWLLTPGDNGLQCGLKHGS